MLTIEITLPAELRAEAIRARDEHGNTDFYTLLRTAADEIDRLRQAVRAAQLLVEEITDCEGREGMTDHDFAEQVLALAHSTSEKLH